MFTTAAASYWPGPISFDLVQRSVQEDCYHDTVATPTPGSLPIIFPTERQLASALRCLLQPGTELRHTSHGYYDMITMPLLVCVWVAVNRQTDNYSLNPSISPLASVSVPKMKYAALPVAAPVT